MRRNTHSWRSRGKYWFDNQMGKGAGALILWLALLAVAVIFLLSVIVLLARPNEPSLHWSSVLWDTFMHALDSGAVSTDSGDALVIATMLLASISGMLLLSTLIGLINAGIESKLETLRRGRSKVLETDHTVILGWSPHVFTIIEQLAIANESKRDACIVVLADRDKVAMEEEIRTRITDFRTTRVVCRSGNPSSRSDLEIASPDVAKAIIIPPPETEHPDITVIKIILALMNLGRHFADAHNIVTSIFAEENIEVARIAGRGSVRSVLFERLISRITAQTCRQSGLSVVYSELLQYDGSEFYFVHEPRLTGSTFAQAMFSYARSTVIGIAHADGNSEINPGADMVIAADDELILLAEDDSTIAYDGYHAPAPLTVAPPPRPPRHRPERFLFVHWNDRAPRIIHELDMYVEPGSEILIVGVGPEQEAAIEELRARLTRLTMSTSPIDPTKSRNLSALAIDGFDHIIVLSNEHIADIQEKDARTLAILLMLRNVLGERAEGISIVSEMHDVRNRDLAAVAKADDFIVSSQIDSMLLTQIAEEPRMAAVIEDLFDADGNEIYLKPVEEYFDGELTAPFSAFVELCLRRGQVAIGYRTIARAHDETRNFGVRINPPKDAPVRLGPGDKLIVFSED
ncbi:MAG: potassium transporter TrkA [Bacteroidota bacterium]|nr:potassium transporter TrkA [Bacteroidota bacterium]